MAVGARVGQPTRLRDDAERQLARSTLAEIGHRVAPVTLAEARRIEVVSALSAVLPEGLQRGSVVGISGHGSLSLAMAVVAGAAQGDGWVATVGCDDLCLAAAEHLGVPLRRLVAVGRPHRGMWSTVVAALLDSFQVVVAAPGAPVTIGDARRLRARARERGGVLVDLVGSWPEVHDMSLRIVESQWQGLGRGHGVLEARKVAVAVSGRRGSTLTRVVPLWLPGPDGAPAAVDDHIHAGADIDALLDAGSVPGEPGGAGDQRFDLVDVRRSAG